MPGREQDDREDHAEAEQRRRHGKGRGVTAGVRDRRGQRAGVVRDQVAGRRGQRDRAQGGRPDRSAHLLHGVDQRRGHARVLAPDAGRGRVDGRGEDHAEAQAHDEQGGQDATRVAGGGGEPGQVAHRDDAQHHAGGDQDARPEPGQGHDAGDVGADQDAAHERQEQQPAGQRAVALDHLQIVGEEQEDTEDRDPGQADRDVGAAAGAVQDHPQREQRVADPLLGEHEGGQEQHPGGQAADGQRGRPAGGLGVGEPEDDKEQSDRGQDGAGPVHSRPGGRPGASDVGQGADDGDHGEHQVDVQGVAPREVLGQEAAQDQADAAAAGGDRAEDAEGPAPLARVLKGADQGAQGGRREDGAERALQRPRRDQHREGDGGAAESGGEGEPGQARDEDPFAAEHVADPAAQQQQAAESQGVGRHHPLPVAVGKAQRTLSGRQRDVHDGGIQDHHELRHGDHDQDQPAPLHGGGRAVGRGRGNGLCHMISRRGAYGKCYAGQDRYR